MRVQLRPYQGAALDEIRARFAESMRAPLFVLPTGGGKTVTYAAIADGAAARGNRVVILEHRKELIRQCSMALAGLGLRHQIVAPEDKVAAIRRAHIAKWGLPAVHPEGTVAVASVQTLARRMDWLQEFDPTLIIIDEAHHAVAGTWAKIIAACPTARLLGVTATPCRTNGQGLGDVFDCMVLGPTMQELIGEGFLVRPRVFAPPVLADLSGVHITGGDFNSTELAEALDKPTITGDAISHYQRLAPARPAIVFCASISHANHVAEQFRGAGFRFEVVSGDQEDGERDERIQGLADGRLHGICTVDVVSEGTDIPVAEVAILLRPTESESLFLQQVGRVLRPAEGKEYGLILDHVGNVMRHGMPDADRDWTLEGRKKGARGKANQEPTFRIQQCIKCYMVHEPAPACPHCGHIYPVRSRQPGQREGELQEITSAAAPAKPKIRTGAARDLKQLQAMGISDGRAARILEARQEKEALQTELRELVLRWAHQTAQGIHGRWGFTVTDIRDMKPKRLREAIGEVSQALFIEAPAAPAPRIHDGTPPTLPADFDLEPSF